MFWSRDACFAKTIIVFTENTLSNPEFIMCTNKSTVIQHKCALDSLVHCTVLSSTRVLRKQCLKDILLDLLQWKHVLDVYASKPPPMTVSTDGASPASPAMSATGGTHGGVPGLAPVDAQHRRVTGGDSRRSASQDKHQSTRHHPY